MSKLSALCICLVVSFGPLFEDLWKNNKTFISFNTFVPVVDLLPRVFRTGMPGDFTDLIKPSKVFNRNVQVLL